MNSDGEDVVVAQERRIWWYRHFGNNITIGLDSHMDEPRTVSEVQNFIVRHVENGTDDTIVPELTIDGFDLPDTHLTEQECTLLGQSCQPLVHHLEKLEIVVSDWTDSETSCILSHMSLESSTIDHFVMIASDEETPTMSMTIRTLCDSFPAYLDTIELSYVVFTSEDCHILGQMISNKECALDCLDLEYCCFPRLVDFLTLIEGFVKDKIPSDHCSFRFCYVKDASIPKHDGEDYLEFVRIFGEFWQRRHGEPEKTNNTDEQAATRLEKSADDMLNYFRPMQEAGLLTLLPPPTSENTGSSDASSVIETRQPLERGEWVKAFGHEAVNDRVDLLFHILLLNPEVCVQEREWSEPQHHRRKKVRRNKRVREREWSESQHHGRKKVRRD